MVVNIQVDSNACSIHILKKVQTMYIYSCLGVFLYSVMEPHKTQNRVYNFFEFVYFIVFVLFVTQGVLYWQTDIKQSSLHQDPASIDRTSTILPLHNGNNHLICFCLFVSFLYHFTFKQQTLRLLKCFSFPSLYPFSSHTRISPLSACHIFHLEESMICREPKAIKTL